MISQSEGPTGHVGHEGTPMNTILVSRVVIVKMYDSRGASAWFVEAKWPKNRLKVA